MRILMSGYVLGEGRMSMILFARSLHRHLPRVLRPGDSIGLDEGGGNRPNRRGISVKLEKRLVLPMRLRMRGFDILHIIDADYAAAIPASRLGCTVVTCHDMMPALQAEHVPGPVFSRMGAHFFEIGLRKMAQSARVVTDSEFSRDCVLKYTNCSGERIQAIHPGVDLAQFKRIPKDDIRLRDFRQQYGLTGKRVMLHIGPGRWYKNVETVLRVVREVIHRGHRNLVLLKVGDLTAEQEQLAAQLGIADRIARLSRLAEEAVPLAYNAADLLLWPSLFEGFGLCVPEAMACGTPVVCSNGGSLPEVAGDAAAMHDPTDVDAFTGSCCQVLEDEAFRRTLREAGFKQAAKFRWEETAAQYYRVYTVVHQELSS